MNSQIPAPVQLRQPAVPAARSEFLETQRFKKRLYGLSGTMLCYYAGTAVFAVLFGLILGLLSGVFPGVQAWMQTDTYIWIEQIVLSALTMLVPFSIYARLSGFRVWGLFRPRRTTGALLGVALTSGLALCFVASLAAGLVSNLFTALTHLPSSVDLPVPTTLAGTILFFAAVAVEAPIVEEYVFRGVILQTLRPYGNSFAILMSAIFFAVLHGNVAQGVGTFIMGLVFGFLAVKSGSLIPSVLLHALNNTMACMETLLQKRLTPPQFLLFQYGMMGVVFLVGLTVLILYAVKHPGFFRIRESVPRLAVPVRRSLVARNGLLIAFWCVSALNFILTMLLTAAS